MTTPLSRQVQSDTTPKYFHLSVGWLLLAYVCGMLTPIVILWRWS